jgi:hypothetical protein
MMSPEFSGRALVGSPKGFLLETCSFIVVRVLPAPCG